MRDAVLLTRAWLVAHRAVPAVCVALAAAALFGIWGTVSIQVWGAAREVPLWALAPGTLAMIVSTAFDDQVESPPLVRPGWVVRARMLWVAALVGGATLLAVPSAWALHDSAIAWVTGLFVAASFVPAAVDPRLGPLLGAAVDVVALVYGGQVAADRGMSSVVGLVSPALWLIAAGAAGAGVLVYVVGRTATDEWRTRV